MKLTGKCKEAFRKWFDENYNDYWTYYHTKPVILNALIIEFFDSVGLWEIQFYKAFFSLPYKEAINAAIEKANEIFNQ